jgi:hypothetical protein
LAKQETLPKNGVYLNEARYEKSKAQRHIRSPV